MRSVGQPVLPILAGTLVFLAVTASFARQSDDVSSSVVRIYVSATAAQGSGIVVARQQNDAVVLTAYHVIAEAERFTVTFGSASGRRFEVTRDSDLIGWQNSDRDYGLAVFRVRNITGLETRGALLGSSSELRPGDALVYMGFPGGATTLRRLAGNVSALQGTSVVMDRSVSEGGSGGAVVKDGLVVGIAAGREAADLTYAVAVDVARLALRGWGIEVPAARSPVASDASPSADAGIGATGQGRSTTSTRLSSDPRQEIYSMPRGAKQEFAICDAVVTFLGVDASGTPVIDVTTEGATRRFALARGRGDVMAYCGFSVFDVALDGSRASVMFARLPRHFP